eukprot:COSAG02_NODE_2034_length_10056_cov_5.336748_6_plen_773_part_00
MQGWQSPSHLMSREQPAVRGSCEVYSESADTWYHGEVLHSLHGRHEVHVRYNVDGETREKWLSTGSKQIRNFREFSVQKPAASETHGFMHGFGAAFSKKAEELKSSTSTALKAVNTAVPLGLSRAVDLPECYVGKSAEELHKQAEKVGWLHKEGHSLATVARMDTFKKRWCLLLPGTVPDGQFENLGSSDRWLVYYPDKTATSPDGAFVLPVGGYTVRKTQQARAKEWSLHIDIQTGPSANCSYVLAPDTAEGYFSWMETFTMGTQVTSRLPNPSESAVRTELLGALPADVGGTGPEFDSAHPADAALLQRCWAGFGSPVAEFVVKGDKWKDFGFQRDDPVSDLRACGRLALLQLVYFLEHHPQTARGMCAAQVQDDDITNAYPWATASVAITRMLCMFMDLVEPFGIVSRWEACKKKSWHFMSSINTFHEVYCIMFECLDKEFKQTGGTYMTFPTVLAAVREKFSHILLDTNSDETLVQLRSRAAAAFRPEEDASTQGRPRRLSMYPADMFHLNLSTSADVPVLFKLLTARLLALGAASSPDVYRRPGDDAMVEYLQHEISKGENPAAVLDACDDVHTVSTLFMRFLLQLPEPIIPPSHYDAVHALGEDPTLEELSEFVETLPPVNREMLLQLVSHLQQHTGADGSPGSLAIFFAPALICHHDPNDLMQHSAAEAKFTQALLAKLPPREHEHTDAMVKLHAMLSVATAARSVVRLHSGRAVHHCRAQAEEHRSARLVAEEEHAAHVQDHAAMDAELAELDAQIKLHQERHR